VDDFEDIYQSASEATQLSGPSQQQESEDEFRPSENEGETSEDDVYDDAVDIELDPTGELQFFDPPSADSQEPPEPMSPTRYALIHGSQSLPSTPFGTPNVSTRWQTTCFYREFRVSAEPEPLSWT
jgi:hypothetical protein